MSETTGTRRPIPWRVRMSARRIDEEHRASTPLELLFDLTFVVAVAQAASQLAHAIEEDRIGHAVPGFLMVFFAIWWAWMNFTWFASAYDTDDVPYRVLTLLQMAGVLILAAGVPALFEKSQTGTVVVGYVVMRIAMVAQWLRAAGSDPDHRGVALRYAGAIAVIQVGWVLRLLLPDSLVYVSFALLALAELSAPWFAERGNMTTWHPHHIAERYGLFTIIVLGECVTAAMVAVQAGVGEAGWNVTLIVVFAAALILLFSLWWIYYLKPAGEGLQERPQWAFLWGYGHIFIFGSLTALGAALEVAAVATTHHLETPDTVVTYAVAVPVAVFLVLVWGLHAPLGAARIEDGIVVVTLAALTLLLAALPALGVSVAVTTLLLALPPVGLIAVAVATGRGLNPA